MAVHELGILRPLDASIQNDQSQWPEFTLRNVKVVSQNTGSPASLLAAHGGNLLRVEGFLSDVDPDYAHLLKVAKYRNRAIRIDDVALYSFSQYDDGSLGFWAAGKAGWFEIGSATPRYKPTFEGMNEATGMFYYLADKYKNSRSRLLKEANRVVDTHVKHIFNDYANSDYCTRTDNEDIRDGFYEHHNFLMKSMIEGQEGLQWETAPVLRHLKRQFPADFREMQRIVTGGPAPVAMEEDEEDEEQSAAEEPPERKPIKAERSKGRATRSGSSAQGSQRPEDDDLESGLTTPPRKGKRKSHLRPRSERSAKRFTRYDTRARSTTQDDTDMQDEIEDERPGTAAADSFAAANAAASQLATTAAAEDNVVLDPPKRAPLPSYYEPHGPGDTWTCPYDGCTYKVWEGRKPASVELMKTHFGATHADTMEDLINAESRPWAGVSHLLQRLKGLVAVPSQSNNTLTSDQALPERILKRY